MALSECKKKMATANIALPKLGRTQVKSAEKSNGMQFRF